MMIGIWRFPLALAVWVVFGLMGTGAAGQTSAFSYQGSLEAGAAAADGSFDLRFSVFAAEAGGDALGTVERAGVAVDAGVFSVELDFGGVVFEAGADRWLEVAVRGAGDGDFTTLTPRTRIVGVPYATRAAVAGLAEYALDGPFQPADDTPRDSSGAEGSTVSGVFTLTGAGGSGPAPVGVVLPIVMEAPLFAFPGGGGGTEPARVVRLQVWRTPAADTAWYDAFLARRAAALTVTVSPAQGAGETEFVFPGMEVTGYRVERGLDGGPVEVLSLRQIGNNPGFVRTNREPDLSLLSAPLAGGTRLPATGTAGPMIYSWSTAPAGLHSASVLPEERSTVVTGGFIRIDTEPVGMVVNALSAHGVWQDFIGGVGRSVSLFNGDGSVAWPKVGGPRIAFLVGWELRRAPDGGVYESYQLGVPRQ